VPLTSSTKLITIYPITPSSTMGELTDHWSADHQSNIWGSVPQVIEMQSEGGAAVAAAGIPNLYKVADELTSAVFDVTA
jgi:pyruvate-ferredoxin/flavodoxin oxidoreductase